MTDQVIESVAYVLPMGFSPVQVRCGFGETGELAVECSWGERAYT